MIVKLGYKEATKKFICRVQFPNKQTGEVEEGKVIPMNDASYGMFLNQKFKKSGYEIRANS